MVMSSLPFCPNSGRYRLTGSFSRTLPSSYSFIIDMVVATHLVSDAISKIVSTVIRSRVGSSDRIPNAFRYTTCPSCPTSSTPGISPCATAASISGSSTAASFAPWLSCPPPPSWAAPIRTAPATISTAAAKLQIRISLITTPGNLKSHSTTCHPERSEEPAFPPPRQRRTSITRHNKSSPIERAAHAIPHRNRHRRPHHHPPRIGNPSSHPTPYIHRQPAQHARHRAPLRRPP